MKVLTFYNAKGGVGKTTSALSVAAVLARNHSVCAIDLDITQNSLSSILFPDYRNEEYSIIDAMMGLINFKDVLYDSIIANIKVCPCLPDKVNESALSIDSFPRREDSLKIILKEANAFDFVIIDCPPAMNSLTRNAIVASDGVVVPFKNDKFAYNGISTMLQESAKIKNTYNPDLKFLGVFFTHDKKTRVNTQAKEQLHDDLGARFLQSTIRDSVLIPESTYVGLPVVNYKPYSDVAYDYDHLTDEIIAKLNQR